MDLSFFDVCAFLVGGLCLLSMLALVLMHLPNSPLRTIALRVTAGLFAMVAPLYVVSPIDVVPDVIFPIGFIDDAVVVVGGLVAARYALKGDEGK